MTSAQRQRKLEHLEYLAAVAQNAKAQRVIRRVRNLAKDWLRKSEIAIGLRYILQQEGGAGSDAQAYGLKCSAHELQVCGNQLAQLLPKEPKKPRRNHG